MPVVKNVSDENIVIDKEKIRPFETLEVTDSQLKIISKLINDGKLIIEPEQKKVKRIEKKELDEQEIEEYLNLKERLIQAFFALYMNQPLSENNLEDLKWFYKNVGPTSSVDIFTKSLLDDVVDGEELVEVLLNHVYPELLRIYFEKLKN